jgi:hypothetical protein
MPTVSRLARSLLACTIAASILFGGAPVLFAADRAGDAAGATSTLPKPADARERWPAPRVAARSEWTSRPKPSVPEPQVTLVSTQQTTPYRGRNHVWIPALRIDRAVTGYSCSSSYYPGNRVYRWGCGGTNNVYLFGHAHSVFKPLHDAYVRGRLRKGMKVYYAGSNGRVTNYSVVWWKVTTPTAGAFAYAPLAKPGMTLQTCVGANSRYRLIVRLYRVA